MQKIELGWVPVPFEEAKSIVGEGVHTGLRKGVHESDGGPELWNAIHAHTGAWSEACDFFVWGLDQMGMAICKKQEQADDDDS